jgi:hypothetical protein
MHVQRKKKSELLHVCVCVLRIYQSLGFAEPFGEKFGGLNMHEIRAALRCNDGSQE